MSESSFIQAIKFNFSKEENDSKRLKSEGMTDMFL